MPRPRHKLNPKLEIKSARHVKVVLVRPQKSENIGAAARAMGNMGLGELALVRPASLSLNVVRSMATSAGAEIAAAMTSHETLAEALGGCHLVVGATARLGSHRGPFHTPKMLAREILDLPEGQRCALVFGPERMGLSTADLRLCQKVIRIPTCGPETSSLNLAQAVLIVGYELLTAGVGEPANPPRISAASQFELNGMYDQLKTTLLDIGFLPASNPDHYLMNIKKIFNRTALSSGECNLLRGICRQIRWAVKNSRQLDWAREEAVADAPSRLTADSAAKPELE